MQFKVPQFIDIEDKLFGPFTFFQFAYMIGGGGMAFILYKVLPFGLAIVPIIIVVSLSLLLVFYKINNRPFSNFLQAGLSYFISSKLYIWKQRFIKPSSNSEDAELPTQTSIVPMASASKLKDLSWNLDVENKENH